MGRDREMLSSKLGYIQTPDLQLLDVELSNLYNFEKYVCCLSHPVMVFLLYPSELKHAFSRSLLKEVLLFSTISASSFPHR